MIRQAGSARPPQNWQEIGRAEMLRDRRRQFGVGRQQIMRLAFLRFHVPHEDSQGPGIGAAVAELQRANALQPDMPETLLELGKATAAAGEVSLAEKLFRRVIELEQSSSLAESAHFQLAQLYRKMGRQPESDGEMKLFQEIRKSRK